MKFSGLFSILFLLLLTACKDDCKDVVCNQGGCFEGNCICLAGYEGPLCNMALSARWAGNYALRDSCHTAPGQYYSTTLSAIAGEPFALTITPFYAVNSGITLQAIIDAQKPDSLNFSGMGSGLSFSGYANRNPDNYSITMAFSVTGASGNDDCIAFLEKE